MEVGGCYSVTPGAPNSNVVRQHEYIKEDDPRYAAGTDIENRLEAPPIEMEGDPLDRQRCIYDFDQSIIQVQDCLLLGAGGIGQNVGLTLARVGVRSLTFIDNDNYEASNLSRQLLGSLSDVGKRKVDVAVESIRKFHNISSTIVDGHHLNALVSWDKIVSLARNSSVIFNGIDVGAVFDFAVNSLSKALCIPLVQGQSASWSVNAEFYTGQPGLLCSACSSSITSSFALEGTSFQAINCRLTEWLKCHDSVFSSAPELYRISAASLTSFLQQDRQYRVNGPTTAYIVGCSIQAVNSSLAPILRDGDSNLNDQESIEFCNFKLFLRQYYTFSLERLLPDKICNQTDILFIPRPKGVPTRYVGSWVCPCLAVAAIMVSQWVNYLTGPTGKDPPSSFQLSLASCRTDICDTALECGFVDPPSQSSDQSISSCLTCEKMSSKLEEQLFFSLLPVALQPVSGKTFKWVGYAEGPIIPATTITDTEMTHVSTSHPAIGVSESSSYCSNSSIEIRGGSLWLNMDFLGAEYSNLALDAIPSKKVMPDKAYIEIRPNRVSSVDDQRDLNVTEWPADLRIPLAKAARSHLSVDMGGKGSFVRAFGSGQRSALLNVNVPGQHTTLDHSITHGRWYRLKGCGMQNRGFTVEDVRDDNGQLIKVAVPADADAGKSNSNSVEGATQNYSNLRKIRGAAYQHTCDIELDMTNIISEALKQTGMVCANRSLGRWDYESSALPSTLLSSVEYPLVIRSCALFENLGDRRLSDHVLRGLELLLPLVTTITLTEEQPGKLSDAQISSINALQSVRDMRIGGHGECLDVESCDEYDDRLTRSVLLYNGGVAADIRLFANMASSFTPLIGIKVPTSNQFPSSAPKCLRIVWDRCCKLLSSSSPDINPESDPCLLGYLYYRLGRECGTLGRVLHESNIMWGSYTDATGRHMNAHGNNFALLREGSLLDSSDFFLAPLDFDMSYSQDHCYYGQWYYCFLEVCDSMIFPYSPSSTIVTTTDVPLGFSILIF